MKRRRQNYKDKEPGYTSASEDAEKSFDILLKSTLLAINAHAGQYRKITREQYIVHLFRMDKFIEQEFLKCKNVYYVRALAMLHDAIEDTWITEAFLMKEFEGRFVEDIKSLTMEKTGNKKDDKKKYLAKLLRSSNEAKIVKLADIWDNVHDHPWQQLLIDSYDVAKALEVEDGEVKQIFQRKKSELIICIQKMLLEKEY